MLSIIELKASILLYYRSTSTKVKLAERMTYGYKIDT